MLDYYKFRPKKENNLNTLNIIHKISNLKRLSFLKKLINLFKGMIKKDSKKETHLEVLEDMQDYRIISNDTIDEILKSR